MVYWLIRVVYGVLIGLFYVMISNGCGLLWDVVIDVVFMGKCIKSYVGRM